MVLTIPPSTMRKRKVLTVGDRLNVESNIDPMFSIWTRSGQDFYVPAFRVIVNGEDLSEIESDVISLTYTDKKNEIDHAELTLNNWDPGPRGARDAGNIATSTVLDPWQEIEIWMGYYQSGNDKLRRMMVGELVRMTPNFAADSAATLSVSAMGVLNRFRTAQISKDYHQQKDSVHISGHRQPRCKADEADSCQLTLTTDTDEINRTLASESRSRL